MALPSSGQITLNQVNVELGLSATAQIGLGDSNVRALFNVSSGQIKMSDGYGKSSETVISSSVQEMTVSNYISSGGTLRISSGVYIWSNNVATAGMIIDIPCTIINQGYIIGRGGNGGHSYNSGQSGGDAISVTSAGVTITNSSGAYIAGGGGGGAGSAGASWRAGGGGGAGGGNGGNGTSSSGATGGAIGQNGNSTPGTLGGPAGGGASTYYDYDRGPAWGGAGGGRVLPGNTNAGTNGSYIAGSVRAAGSGGGWAAIGGAGGGGNGGAGGSAISGTARTLNNSGTIYGST